MAQKETFTELGVTGLKRHNGFIDEEFLRELQGTKGIEAFKEMRDNEPVIGSMLFAIEMLIRQVPWSVREASDSNADMEAADFMQSNLDDMSMTWADTISEILSMLPFGWSFHEIVYKRRLGEKTNSRFNDGRVGWRKLPIRSQETLFEWKFDQEGGIAGMVQQAPPDFKIREIPIEKRFTI